MAYADQEMSGSRVVSIVIVALIHIVVGYLLVTGLAISAVQNVIARVTTVDIEEPEPEEEEPPPPPPDETAPPPPVAPPAPINVAVSAPPIQTTTVIEPPREVIREVVRQTPTPTPTATQTPSQARAARPRNQNRWAGRIQDNYPRREQSRGIEGSVRMSVTVGPDGRVTACSVTGSSGSEGLDSAACEGMQRYAQYDAALDAAGNPTSATMTQTIQYQLAE